MNKQLYKVLINHYTLIEQFNCSINRVFMTNEDIPTKIVLHKLSETPKQTMHKCKQGMT